MKRSRELDHLPFFALPLGTNMLLIQIQPLDDNPVLFRNDAQNFTALSAVFSGDHRYHISFFNALFHDDVYLEWLHYFFSHVYYLFKTPLLYLPRNGTEDTGTFGLELIHNNYRIVVKPDI
jgi:hypothetical protein